MADWCAKERKESRGLAGRVADRHRPTLAAPETLDDRCLGERDELLARKYAAGLQPHEAARLAEIDRLLELGEIRMAELIDARGDERLARIDAGLDRVEKAIHDLQVLNPR